MAEQSSYEKAKKRVEELKGFYIHLFIYLLVNIGLVVVNLMVSAAEVWFFWPLFGWGIGIIAHGIYVFGFFGILGAKWEEKKINELMDIEEKKAH